MRRVGMFRGCSVVEDARVMIVTLNFAAMRAEVTGVPKLPEA